jgi:hypothetical protein
MDSLSGTKVSVLVEDTKDGAKSRFNDTGDGGETEIGKTGISNSGNIGFKKSFFHNTDIRAAETTVGASINKRTLGVGGIMVGQCILHMGTVSLVLDDRAVDVTAVGGAIDGESVIQGRARCSNLLAGASVRHEVTKELTIDRGRDRGDARSVGRNCICNID